MPPNTTFVRVTWECPFCDERRTHLHQSVDHSRGRSALLNHIRHTTDEQHGDWRAVPEDLRAEDIHACLTVDPVTIE